MHPHTQAEDDSLASLHYGIKTRMWVSDKSGQPFINSSPRYDPKALLGYDPLLGAHIIGDLDDPLIRATFRLHLGVQPYSLSPHMGLGRGVYVDNRPLFDTGRYVTLEAKCVARDPIVIPATPPSFQAAGPFQASTSTPIPAWPAHQAGDIAVLHVIGPGAEVATLATANGFVEAPGSPVSITGAGTPGVVAYDQKTKLSGATNVVSGNHTPVATPKGIGVLIMGGTGAGGDALDVIASVTYGGVALTRVVSVPSPNNIGRVYLYWLGAGVPGVGGVAQSAVVTKVGGDTTTLIHVEVVSVTANGNTEVVDFKTDSRNTADPQVTLDYGGRSCLGLVGVYHGRNDVLDLVDLTGQTRLDDHDHGPIVSVTSRRTSVGSSNPTMGYTAFADQSALAAFAVAEVVVASTGIRLTTFWNRAASSSMAAPVVASGTWRGAQITTYRGAIESGLPFDGQPQTSTQSGSDTTVEMPAYATSLEQSLVCLSVAVPVKTDIGQVAWMAGVTERTDRFTRVGTGGGYSLATIPFAAPTAIASGSTVWANLATSAPQARYVYAIKGRPVRAFFVNEADIPWRPVFEGRIDVADPSGDELMLECRDSNCDLMDRWFEPGEAGGWVLGDEDIADHLLNLHGVGLQSSGWSGGVLPPFTLIGEPTLFVPRYTVEPQSIMLAMRAAGLQNGWDLRGRWGGGPWPEDLWTLSYYEPDRERSQGFLRIAPDRYTELKGFAKDRREVRNVVEVTSAGTPRSRVKVTSPTSIALYGRQYLGISEDATTFIFTTAQAQSLALAVLSDTKEPKVGAEVGMRFYPFIEVNDLIQLMRNYVHNDFDATLSVSRFEHVLTSSQNGQGIDDGKTVIGTRDSPAAAAREWRNIKPRTQYTSTALPTGTATQGALWTTTITGGA